MPEGTRRMTFTKDNSEKARMANATGRARQREQREQNILEVEQITAKLLGGLGREPIGGETVAAEVIAATTVRARRLRALGRDDGEELRVLRQLLAFTPFGVTPPPPPRIDPAAPGTYFVATKGGDPAPDEATATDEVSNNAV
jgi:hypothetical protein